MGGWVGRGGWIGCGGVGLDWFGVVCFGFLGFVAAPGAFLSQDFGETGGPGIPLDFPFGAPVSVSSYFWRCLLDQDGTHRVWSFLHP